MTCPLEMVSGMRIMRIWQDELVPLKHVPGESAIDWTKANDAHTWNFCTQPTQTELSATLINPSTLDDFGELGERGTLS